MEAMNSFRAYGRMNEIEDYAFRCKTRKRLIVIGLSMLLLIVIIVGAVIGVLAHYHTGGDSHVPSTSMASSIKAMCGATQYQDSCFSSISSEKGATTTNDPVGVFKLSLKVVMDSLKNVSSWMDEYERQQSNDKSVVAAVDDCKELVSDAVDRLTDSLSSVQSINDERLLTSSKISDLQTWLSAAVADQETCLDGFEGMEESKRQMVAATMSNSTQFTSNSLAIVAKVFGILQDLNLNRKLLANDPIPAWITTSQRRTLLQDTQRLKPNVTVAQDGTGDFKTIAKALQKVPKKNMFPFVIYIKEGVYKEYVVVEKNMWHVTMYGDGMYKTIVSGNKNKVDGTSTFKSATFMVVGRRFTAIDMGFENTAGPEKHQAVALRSSSDQSLFFRCSMVGFQDTLYVHSLRQYYRKCDIVGTVDFIFGDASVVFQNCKLMPRQPSEGQMNTITAQGRIDQNENTGIAVQSCTVTPFDNVTVETYLGRPWKKYSTTIFMQSEMGGIVDARGWLEWEPGVVPPATIKYAEYENTGPGAIVGGRVTWPGYRSAITGSEANMFGVDLFIQGKEWIPASLLG